MDQTSVQSKGRRAIAAQACEACRSRKQRCDESQPKCGSCKRLGVECVYKETQPTKRDKTLVEILNRLKSIERKIYEDSPSDLERSERPPQASPSVYFNLLSEDHGTSSYSAFDQYLPKPSGSTNATINLQYLHTSAAYKILTWPVMQQLLPKNLPSDAEPRVLEQEGPAFIMRIQEGTPDLPWDEGLTERPFIGMQSQATRALGRPRVTFPTLTPDMMHLLAIAYFDTFNLIYPFMDRQSFISDTLSKVQTEGFDDDAESFTALLVFALGELAIEGSRGDPIGTLKGRSHWGGIPSSPPGLAFFNEARKHIGFIITQFDLENVQIFCLAALYYEACSRHVEFWRMTVFASTACMTLVTCHTIDWNSPRGDLVKRVYWHCAIMETSLYLELDLPRTGLLDVEAQVGIPSFNSLSYEEDHKESQLSHSEAYYASQIALRRLCLYVHDNMNQFTIDINNPAGTNQDHRGATVNSLYELAEQITQWRGMLPQELQWDENDPKNLPNLPPFDLPDPMIHHNTLPNFVHSQQTNFTGDIYSITRSYSHVYSIQVALLRTRYYYAKHMVFRPFVYKALHYPEHMNLEDALGAAECLKQSLKWPLVLIPTARYKTLIPYQFCWSQNILGVLLILYLTQHNSVLRNIRAELCGPNFEAEADQTVELMIDWIRDLKSVDTIARWCWRILEVVYHVDE